MTEEEAKTKWCPFVRAGSALGGYLSNRIEGNGVPSTLCIGSACMAWRWGAMYTFGTEWNPNTGQPQAFPESMKVSTTEGYCGLAGKP
jgi:hypothetical protein